MQWSPLWRMLFNPRRAFIIQAVGISTVFFSVAAVQALHLYAKSLARLVIGST